MMKKIGLLLILIFHVFILSKFTFTAWPEMLTYPYFFANSFSLYKDFILPYPPALILLLSGVFNFFGFNPYVLKIFTWILILAGDLLLFMIILKISKNYLTSLLSLIFYVILQSLFEGNMLWFDFATVLPLLAGFWFGLQWLEGKRFESLFLASFFLTLAILVKQTAIIYLIGFMLIFLKGIWVRGFWGVWVFGTGVLVLVIPLIIYLGLTDSLVPFWNWVIFYPLTEWSKFPGYVNFVIPKRYLLMLLILLTPLLMSLLVKKQLLKNQYYRFSIVFLLAAILAVYPRFSFFHLQAAAAFLTIALIQVFIFLPVRFKLLHTLFVTFALLVTIKMLLVPSLGDKIRFYDNVDKKLAIGINQVAQKEKVFFLGINSSEYIFTGKIPPRNWSDTFGWYLEIPGVQQWVIEGLKGDPPQKIFIKIPEKGSWFKPGVYQPKKVIEYVGANFIKTGKIEPDIEIWERR